MRLSGVGKASICFTNTGGGELLFAFGFFVTRLAVGARNLYLLALLSAPAVLRMGSRVWPISIALILSILFGLSNTTTLYVTPWQDDAPLASNCTREFPCSSIREAIGLAAANDVIVLLPGVYSRPTMDLDLIVSVPLTIVSEAGRENTTIMGNRDPPAPFMKCTAPCTVQGITFVGFRAMVLKYEADGPMFAVTNCTFRDASPSQPVIWSRFSLTLQSCRFERLMFSGDIHCEGQSASVLICAFHGIVSMIDAHVEDVSLLTTHRTSLALGTEVVAWSISSSTFYNISGFTSVVEMLRCCDPGSVTFTLQDTTFADLRPRCDGETGLMFFSLRGAILEIHSTRFIQIEPVAGDCVKYLPLFEWRDAFPVNATNVTMTECTVGFFGPMVAGYIQASISDSVFERNKVTIAPLIDSNEGMHLTLSHCRFTNNFGTKPLLSLGTSSVTRCQWTGNSVNGSLVNIRSSDLVLLDKLSFLDNNVNGPSLDLANIGSGQKSFRVSNSSFIGNHHAMASAISVTDGTVVLSTNTFECNHASSVGGLNGVLLVGSRPRGSCSEFDIQLSSLDGTATIVQSGPSSFLDNHPIAAGGRVRCNDTFEQQNTDRCVWDVVAGTNVTFVVDALDYCNRSLVGRYPGDESGWFSVSDSLSNELCDPVIDLHDGSYLAVVRPTLAGTHHIQVMFAGEPSLIESPFLTIHVSPSLAQANHSLFSGKGIEGGPFDPLTALTQYSFIVQLRDAFLNNLTRGSDNVTSALFDTEIIINVRVIDLNNGQYECSYEIESSDESLQLTLEVWVNSELALSTIAEFWPGNITRLVVSPNGMGSECSTTSPCSVQQAIKRVNQNGISLIEFETRTSDWYCIPWSLQHLNGYAVTLQPRNSSETVQWGCPGRAGYSVGIEISAGTVRVNQFTFHHCTTALTLGAKAVLELSHSSFVDNLHAISCSQKSVLSVDHCYFVGNTDGAVTISEGLQLLLSHSIFNNNSRILKDPRVDGGAAVFADVLESATIHNCSFVNNSAPGNTVRSHGGAIRVRSPRVHVSLSRFQNNSVIDPSGAERSSNGGALAIDNGKTLDGVGFLNITSSTFTNNHASSSCGALEISVMNTTISGSSFVSNGASISGGAACVSAPIFSMLGCNFSNNEVVASTISSSSSSSSDPVVGGAISISSPTVTMTNSQFDSNSIEARSQDASGGAVFIQPSHSVDQDLPTSVALVGIIVEGSRLTTQEVARGGAIAIKWFDSVSIHDCSMTASEISGNSLEGGHLWVMEAPSSESNGRSTSSERILDLSIWQCRFSNSSATATNSRTAPGGSCQGGCISIHIDSAPTSHTNMSVVDTLVQNCSCVAGEGSPGGDALGGGLALLASSALHMSLTLDGVRLLDNNAIAGAATRTLPGSAAKNLGRVGGNAAGGGLAISAIANESGQVGSIQPHSNVISCEFDNNLAKGGRGADQEASGQFFRELPGYRGGNAQGGAIWSLSSITIDQTHFSNNAVQCGKPGTSSRGAQVADIDSAGAASGGAVYSASPASGVQIERSNFVSNHAGNKWCVSGGGALYSETPIEVIDSNITNCESQGIRVVGGAVAALDVVRLNASRVLHNIANSTQDIAAGGGVAVSSKSLTIVDSELSFNLAVAAEGFGIGGAVFANSSSASVASCSTLFELNEAVFGGAIFAAQVSNDTLFDRCIFRNNHAQIAGGVIFVAEADSRVTTLLESSESIDNQASYGAQGASILRSLELDQSSSDLGPRWSSSEFRLSFVIRDYASNAVNRTDLSVQLTQISLLDSVFFLSGESQNTASIDLETATIRFPRAQLLFDSSKLLPNTKVDISARVLPLEFDVSVLVIQLDLAPCPPGLEAVGELCRKCEEGTYNFDGVECVPCPKSSTYTHDCIATETAMSPTPRVKIDQGYWIRAPESSTNQPPPQGAAIIETATLEACPNPNACVSQQCDTILVPNSWQWELVCSPEAFHSEGPWDPESQCSLGFSDRLCSRCLHNETVCFFRFGKECVNIEEGPSWFREAMLVTALLLVMVCWNSSVGSGEFSTKKTLSFFVQMTYLLNNQVFSRTVSDMFGFFGVVSGGSAAPPPLQPPTSTATQTGIRDNPQLFGIRSAECLMPLLQSPVADFLISMLYPVLVLLPLVILVTAAREAVSIWREARRRNLSFREAFTNPEISASVRSKKSSSSSFASPHHSSSLMSADDDEDRTRSMRIFGGDLSINSNDDRERLVDGDSEFSSDYQQQDTTWIRRLPFVASCIEAALFILYSMLAFLTAKILEVFTCSPSIFDGSDNSFMSSIPWLQCSFTHSPEWRQLVGAAVAFGALYIIGIPTLFIVLLIHSRRVMSSSNEEAKKSHYLRFFVAGLNSHYFWFEVRRDSPPSNISYQYQQQLTLTILACGE